MGVEIIFSESVTKRFSVKKMFLISHKSNQETSAKESVLNTASVLALDPLHDFRVDEKVTLRIYSSHS